MRLSTLPLLRSPEGHAVALEGRCVISGGIVKSGLLRCVSSRALYEIENSVAHIYNERDVSSHLRRDYATYRQTDNESFERTSERWAEIVRAYVAERKLNTDFLFTALEYAGVSDRLGMEIGAGAADLTVRFANLGLPTVALDFFPWEMARARAKAVESGSAWFDCISAPMSSIPFQDASLDLIYCHATLHHALPNRDEKFVWCNPVNLVDTLVELRRALKPRSSGGALFILGEGIYPEHTEPSNRHYELDCINDPSRPYEAWYKLSEYEWAFQQASIFPNFFVWTENNSVRVRGYAETGEFCDLIRLEDRITSERYGMFTDLARWNARSQSLSEFLPDWIALRPNQSGNL